MTCGLCYLCVLRGAFFLPERGDTVDIKDSRANTTFAGQPQEPARTSAIMGSRAYKYALWASDENNRAVGRYVRRQAREFFRRGWEHATFLLNPCGIICYGKPIDFMTITEQIQTVGMAANEIKKEAL